MYAALAGLVDRLDQPGMDTLGVIPWAAPVPFFGDMTTAEVATLGINPSNREFVDDRGRELVGAGGRLPTLRSLGIGRWADADHRSLAEIARACRAYFSRNPYDRWFGVLERVLHVIGASFYGAAPSAVHLDLVPYATSMKWGELPASARRKLVDDGVRALGTVLRDSSVTTLLLNGRSVVRLLGDATPEGLRETGMPAWDLRRTGGQPVRGVAYTGAVSRIGGVWLGRDINVYGWNHNLQSSFGVTAEAVAAIAEWLRNPPAGASR